MTTAIFAPKLGRTLAGLLLVITGCATAPKMSPCVTHPDPPSEEVRDCTRLIAVVGTASPATAVARPMNKGKAAGMGAAAGFVVCAGAGFESGDAYGAMLGLFLAPVAAASGAVYGTVAGMNKGEYERISATLEKTVQKEDLPARLERGCTDAIRRLSPQTALVVKNAPVVAKPAILELAALQIALAGEEEINPLMTLNCTVRVRLLSASQGEELFAGEFHYFGATHTLREWAANDGIEFSNGITAACTALEGQIAERLFLVCPIPGNFLESRIIPCNDKKN
jgi:hypothetical protein